MLRFIAHYNIYGFYDEHLSTPDRHACFLNGLIASCERDVRTARPDLRTDAKAVLLQRLRSDSTWAELSPIQVSTSAEN